jgi:predicted enzyme related to lactoylglutathione lyase
MCDDIEATMTELAGRGAEFIRPVTQAAFGLVTGIRIPGGGEIGLYQPRHETAYNL